MEYATLLRLTMECDKPLDELKVAIFKMAQFHPDKQLDIYKELGTWLGVQVTEIEKQSQTKPPNLKEGEQNGG